MSIDERQQLQDSGSEIAARLFPHLLKAGGDLNLFKPLAGLAVPCGAATPIEAKHGEDDRSTIVTATVTVRAELLEPAAFAAGQFDDNRLNEATARMRQNLNHCLAPAVWEFFPWEALAAFEVDQHYGGAHYYDADQRRLIVTETATIRITKLQPKEAA